MKTQIVKWTTKIGQEIAKNSPTILTTLGVVGAATTAVLASKASVEAYKKLEEIKETNEDATAKEKAVAVLPLYIPTAIMFVTTATCIISSHTISARRQMALASAYSLSTEAMKEMQNKVEETYGKKKAEKLQNDIRNDHYVANPPTDEKVILTGYGNALFYDEMSGRYFRCDINRIKSVINNLNEDVNNGQFALLNDFYSQIGLKPVKLGDDMGWHSGTTGKIDISFDYVGASDSGEPCGILVYHVAPTFGD